MDNDDGESVGTASTDASLTLFLHELQARNAEESAGLTSTRKEI